MQIDRYLEIQQLCNQQTYDYLKYTGHTFESFKTDNFFEYFIEKNDIVLINKDFST